MSFRFRKFAVYKEIVEFVRSIYRTTDQFPKGEFFGLTNQIRRASTSIALNLAEGSDRGSDREFKRFINISIGSANEVVAVLDIALDNKYIDQKMHNTLLEKAGRIVRQLSALAQRLTDK